MRIIRNCEGTARRLATRKRARDKKRAHYEKKRLRLLIVLLVVLATALGVTVARTAAHSNDAPWGYHWEWLTETPTDVNDAVKITMSDPLTASYLTESKAKAMIRSANGLGFFAESFVLNIDGYKLDFVKVPVLRKD